MTQTVNTTWNTDSQPYILNPHTPKDCASSLHLDNAVNGSFRLHEDRVAICPEHPVRDLPVNAIEYILHRIYFPKKWLVFAVLRGEGAIIIAMLCCAPLHCLALRQ